MYTVAQQHHRDDRVRPCFGSGFCGGVAAALERGMVLVGAMLLSHRLRVIRPVMVVPEELLENEEPEEAPEQVERERKPRAESVHGLGKQVEKSAAEEAAGR